MHVHYCTAYLLAGLFSGNIPTSPNLCSSEERKGRLDPVFLLRMHSNPFLLQKLKVNIRVGRHREVRSSVDSGDRIDTDVLSRYPHLHCKIYRVSPQKYYCRSITTPKILLKRCLTCFIPPSPKCLHDVKPSSNSVSEGVILKLMYRPCTRINSHVSGKIQARHGMNS